MQRGRSWEDEMLFSRRTESEEAVKSLLPGRRLLIYGDVGAGKSSLLNMLLYLSWKKHQHMPVRVLLSEQNVDRAVQEILYTVCIELVRQARMRSIRHPIDSLKRWTLDKRKIDDFYDYLARLIGSFEEEKVSGKAKTKSVGGSVGTGAILPGGTVEGRFESQETIETRLKSKVESLPARIIEDYFKDMINAVTQIGFKGISVGLDEADHIQDISKVVGMLTRARGILFASGKETFVIAGSEALVKESARVVKGIFDVMIPMKSLDPAEIKNMLDKRISTESANNKQLTADKLFEHSALRLLYEYSSGSPKAALRLAANCLIEAALDDKNISCIISNAHVKKAWLRSTSELAEILDEGEIRVLNALEKLHEASPSSEGLQKEVSLSRPSLTKILLRLHKDGHVRRRKKGKSYYYYV
jgi:GTPase SAR1 family protein